MSRSSCRATVWQVVMMLLLHNSPLSQRHGSLDDLGENWIVTSIEQNQSVVRRNGKKQSLPNRFQQLNTERKLMVLTHSTATHQALAIC